MIAIDIEKIEKSFSSVSPKLDKLTEVFYFKLFAMHPELKALYDNVGLVSQRRKGTSINCF